ncbi:hypothetical protein AXF42_Ash013137 [Apostasia shenzhenica]|uniref:Uncharacterized protein n=1 Tax=Apostasia shenzhenica TaxID=1088818 RepID=A0A2I0BD43_9ASPA|nr:hypothetical protein AXF42_Ash013137 [Apostasia shenzhenica]
MAVPGYGGCLAFRSKTRKAMFLRASSSHSDWRDYYFFVGGDLGIPLTPEVCLPEFIGDAKWMAGQDTLKNLERLKGQSWPLKDFLRHVKNDISLHAKALRYIIFKEVAPPHGSVLMKRARRGQPPVVKLSREVTEVEEEEYVIEVSELVCGETAVDVVSSPEDAVDDKKTLTELYAGKGKQLAVAAEPRAVPKGDKEKGIAIGGKKGEEKEEGLEGAQKEGAEGEDASPCLALVLSEVLKRKRGLPENIHQESPLKKGKTLAKEAVGGGHDWQRSVESPFSTNFIGQFEGGGLVTRDLEERVERSSTTDLYIGIINMAATIIARLPLALTRALRTEEQVLEQGVYKYAMGALKADNKALREKLNKVAGDQEAIAAEKSAAVVKAYKISLPCRKERLDGIKRVWEGARAAATGGRAAGTAATGGRRSRATLTDGRGAGATAASGGGSTAVQTCWVCLGITTYWAVRPVTSQQQQLKLKTVLRSHPVHANGGQPAAPRRNGHLPSCHVLDVASFPLSVSSILGSSSVRRDHVIRFPHHRPRACADSCSDYGNASTRLRSPLPITPSLLHHAPLSTRGPATLRALTGCSARADPSPRLRRVPATLAPASPLARPRLRDPAQICQSARPRARLASPASQLRSRPRSPCPRASLARASAPAHTFLAPTSSYFGVTFWSLSFLVQISSLLPLPSALLLLSMPKGNMFWLLFSSKRLLLLLAVSLLNLLAAATHRPAARSLPALALHSSTFLPARPPAAPHAPQIVGFAAVIVPPGTSPPACHGNCLSAAAVRKLPAPCQDRCARATPAAVSGPVQNVRLDLEPVRSGSNRFQIRSGIGSNQFRTGSGTGYLTLESGRLRPAKKGGKARGKKVGCSSGYGGRGFWGGLLSRNRASGQPRRARQLNRRSCDRQESGWSRRNRRERSVTKSVRFASIPCNSIMRVSLEEEVDPVQCRDVEAEASSPGALTDGPPACVLRAAELVLRVLATILSSLNESTRRY